MSLSKKLFVNRLIGPNDLKADEKDNPGWTEIETAIRSLNGDTCTLLILFAGDPVPHMGIGGGKDGKYVLYATEDNLTFHNLVNSKTINGKFSLKAGGQQGDYDLKSIVELSSVLRAAKTYIETGQYDETLTWEVEKAYRGD